MNGSHPTRDEVARRAYQLWQERGQPEGQSDEIWFAAERELRGTATAGDRSRSTPAVQEEPSGGGVRITEMDRGLSPGERQRVRSRRKPRNEAAPAESSLLDGEHFIVVADRGHLRIYREDPSATPGSGALELIEAFDVPAGKRGYTSQDTDMAGRFPGSQGVVGGVAPGGQSIDERLPMQEEQERRIAADLASRLTQFLNLHPRATWDYAAGPSLHNALLERLSPALRRRLGEALQKDLANQPLNELRSHFRSHLRNPAA